jgi:hypothetical protein
MQQGLQSISSGSMLGEGEDGEEAEGKYALGQLLRARCQQEQDVTAPAASPLVLYPDSELVDWLVESGMQNHRVLWAGKWVSKYNHCARKARVRAASNMLHASAGTHNGMARRAVDHAWQ